MIFWNPWLGCQKCSDGCQNCKAEINGCADIGEVVEKTTDFFSPVLKLSGDVYKIKSNEQIIVCPKSDFFIGDADKWRSECWEMIYERSDLTFIIKTKRVDRILSCLPENWGEGYENVIVVCMISNQENADKNLEIFIDLPIKHKQISCEPLTEQVLIEKYLSNIERVFVFGEKGKNARVLSIDWVKSLREQCVRTACHFQFKNTGTRIFKDGKERYVFPLFRKNKAKKLNLDI